MAKSALEMRPFGYTESPQRIISILHLRRMWRTPASSSMLMMSMPTTSVLVPRVRGSTASLSINRMDSVSTARAIWRVTDGGLRLGQTLNGHQSPDDQGRPFGDRASLERKPMPPYSAAAAERRACAWAIRGPRIVCATRA